MMIAERTRGTLELSLAMGLSGTIGYFVVDSGQPSGHVIFFRCVFGAISLGFYCYITGIFTRLQISYRTTFLILLGGAALVTNWYFLFSSFEYVPISIATAIYHTQPLFLVIAGALILKERPKFSAYGWMTVAFFGLGLVVEINPVELQLNGRTLIGGGLALTAGILYTFATLVAKKTTTIPPAFVAFLQVTLGIIMMVPLVDFSSLPNQPRSWMDLLALGVIHTGFMYILLYASFRRLPTSMIAVLLFIYPAVTILVDRVAFGVLLGFGQFIGIGLILLAGIGVKLGWPLAPRFFSRSIATHHTKT